MTDHVQRWQALTKHGLVVSIACGSSRDGGVPFFTVIALSSTGDTFSRPFAADSFEQAVEIAEIECAKRGWSPLGGAA